MSTVYKKSSEVPDEVLCARLKELADCVATGDGKIREFSMRVPAELDRDADLVMCEAANRIERLTARIKDYQYACNQKQEIINQQAEEIRYLRQYGNKDCTAMADDALLSNDLDQ